MPPPIPIDTIDMSNSSDPRQKQDKSAYETAIDLFEKIREYYEEESAQEKEKKPNPGAVLRDRLPRAPRSGSIH